MQLCPEDFEPIRRTLFLYNTLADYTKVLELSINLTKIHSACLEAGWTNGSHASSIKKSLSININLLLLTLKFKYIFHLKDGLNFF